MGDTFRAAVLFAPNKPLEIVELIFPELEDGQVLVKILFSGVCRSQLMEVKGNRGVDKWLPHLLGHEGVGIIEKIGPRVTKVDVGQKVVVGWIPGQGSNANPPRYMSTEGIQINSGVATTFSEYSVVSENRVYLAPQGFSESFLPLFGCALLTGGGMAIKHFNPTRHRNLLVLGFGGVGSSAAMSLHSRPDTQLVIVDESEERRVQALQMGFSNVYSVKDLIHLQQENLMPKFDLCIESAGTTESIELGFSLIEGTGELVFASHPRKGAKISIDPFELIMGKSILGTFGGGVEPDKDVDQISSTLLNSNLNIESMLGEVFKLEDVNRALEQLELGRAGRPLIRMQRADSE
jgi:S-(hydroxymethyl)glutathione dehydrogenase/alcohol dehydrogenase